MLLNPKKPKGFRVCAARCLPDEPPAASYNPLWCSRTADRKGALTKSQLVLKYVPCAEMFSRTAFDSPVGSRGNAGHDGRPPLLVCTRASVGLIVWSYQEVCPADKKMTVPERKG